LEIVAEYSPQLRDASRKGAFGYRRLGPDRVEKFILRDQPLSVVQEKQEEAESLRLNGYDLSRLQQQEITLPNLDVAEAKDT